MSQVKQDYLKKYLSGENADAKKKKKRPKVKGSGMKIIDDDVDVSKIRALDNDELEILGGGEDAPVIVGIIDDRPDHVKVAEHYSKDKWRVITEDDGFNFSIDVQNARYKEKRNNDKTDRKSSDSDLSPNRSRKTMLSINESGDSRPANSKDNPDLDLSLIRDRRSKKNTSHNRKSQLDSDVSPIRNKNNLSRNNKPNYDSDLSPVRNKKTKNNSNDKNESDSDLSPVRSKEIKKLKSKRSSSDSDLSPPRNKKTDIRKRDNSHSDVSSTRSSTHNSNKNKCLSSNRGQHSGSYLSPMRHKKIKKESDDDLSPPSCKNEKIDKGRVKRSRWDTDDSKECWNNSEAIRIDASKSFERKQSDDNKHSRFDKAKDKFDDRPRDKYNSGDCKGRKHEKRKHDPKRVERTLDGKETGFQDAKRMREENSNFKRQEDEMFDKLSDEMTGRNAKAIKRNLGKRETSEEREKQRQKEEKQKELDAKYDRWGKGVKQIEEHENLVKDYVREAAKPFARHRDDKDLEDSLKTKERDGDPMLEYMRRKEKERGETSGVPVRPVYKGPYPSNRFNIRPGHRWDGVDRSNGHEKNYFLANSKRAAMEAEKYKWSTEDM